jgi:peptidoglycan/LPS O-acetylase OafA/YrhL
MRQYPQLDGLRAIAVALVILDHYWNDNFLLGMLGVQLFFVLSGFLITQRLIALRGVPLAEALKSFYIRRTLRIFPLYYATLAVLIAVNLPGARHYSLWLLLYATNICVVIHHAVGTNLGHFWTLAVEEQFYLIWPCVMLTVPGRYLRGVILSVIGGAFLFRVANTMLLHHTLIATRFTPLSCMDALALGALLALGLEKDWKQLSRIGLVAALAVIATILFNRQGAEAGWYIAELPAALACVTAVGAAVREIQGPVGAALRSGVLRYLGRISYGIYILHLPMHYYVRNSWIALALTLTTAAISWHFLESPLVGLARRLTASDRRSLQNPPFQPKNIPVLELEA